MTLFSSKSDRSGSRGAVIVEAAFSLPILIVLVAFMFETLRFAVTSFVLSEVQASSIRMLSLPPSETEIEAKTRLCSEKVSETIEEQTRFFLVPLLPESYKVKVNVINNERIELESSATITCKFCLSGLGGFAPFQKELRSDAALESGEPPCEPDSWQVRR